MGIRRRRLFSKGSVPERAIAPTVVVGVHHAIDRPVINGTTMLLVVYIGRLGWGRHGRGRNVGKSVECRSKCLSRMGER